MGYKSFQIYKIKKDIIGSLFIFYWSKLKLKIVKKIFLKLYCIDWPKISSRYIANAKYTAINTYKQKKALFFSEGEALTLMPENGIIQ